MVYIAMEQSFSLSEKWEKFFQNNPSYQILSFKNLKELIKILEEYEVIGLFLDFRLMKENHLEIIKYVVQAKLSIPVFYLSSQNEEEYHLINKLLSYLASQKELELQNEKKLLFCQKDSLCIALKGNIVVIKFSDIKYIESEKRTAIIHEQDLDRKIYLKLSDLEEVLPNYFVRCHQSYIVNFDMVREMKAKDLLLKTGEKIPISQLKCKETREKFIQFLKEN